jgi:hypothetical protein
VRAGDLQGLCHLLRQGPAKQRRDFGRGDKVTARRPHAVLLGVGQCAKFGTAIGVVTEAGGVQGLVHEDVKTDPASGVKNGPADVVRELAR